MCKDSLLHKGLKEKYYHSRGALSCEEGNFGQAIRFFRKALALDDQAFTHAHLSLAYGGKGDLKRALDEISKAVALCPSNAEYLLQRSKLWHRTGNVTKAEADYKHAVLVDPSAGEIESIRKALAVIEDAFSGEIDSEYRDVHNPLLSCIIKEKTEIRKRMHDAVDCQSCIVPCPAYCCHFSKDTLLHGLFLGSWKLHEVRRHFKEQGMKEKEFLARFSVTDADQRLQLIPPDRMLPGAGYVHVYFPQRSRKKLGQRLAKNKPMGRGYSDISWITKDSRSCAFLSEGRCIIHDTGADPALSSCKEFQCLTGFIFLVLDHLGLVERSILSGMEIGELNRIALKAALMLAHRIFDKAVETELNGILEQAMCADASGDELRCSKLVERYRQAERDYATEMTCRIGKVKSDIRLLLVR